MSEDRIEILENKISELKFENLLIQDLEVIEKGLTFLEHQIPTRKNETLDILAVDNENVLVVIELKVEEKDTQLFQGIRYLDWATSNLLWLAQTYEKEKGVKIDTNYMPSLILIAPSFSEKLKIAAKYICPYVYLYDYIIVKSKDDIKIICREIDYGEIDFPEKPLSISGHKEYIKDVGVRQVLSYALSLFTENNVEVRVRKGSIVLLDKGNIIGRIKCRRNYFKIKSYLISDEENEYKNIDSKVDWENVWINRFKPFLV